MNRLKRKASLSKGISKRKTARIFISHLLEFTPKKPVKMFAYLISEVQCNIYLVCISTATKAASPDLPQRFDQERSLVATQQQF